MSKFFSLCAAFLIFLVSTAAALPQDHLAPAAHTKEAANIFTEREIPHPSMHAANDASESGHASLSMHPRQVHNADYGSNNGPTGNPQAAQQTSTSVQSSTPAAHDSQTKPTSGAADDSSKEQKRRDFVPRPSHDVDYSES